MVLRVAEQGADAVRVHALREQNHGNLPPGHRSVNRRIRTECHSSNVRRPGLRGALQIDPSY